MKTFFTKLQTVFAFINTGNSSIIKTRDDLDYWAIQLNSINFPKNVLITIESNKLLFDIQLKETKIHIDKSGKKLKTIHKYANRDLTSCYLPNIKGYNFLIKKEI